MAEKDSGRHPDSSFNDLLQPVYQGKGLTDPIKTAEVST